MEGCGWENAGDLGLRNSFLEENTANHIWETDLMISKLSTSIQQRAQQIQKRDKTLGEEMYNI